MNFARSEGSPDIDCKLGPLQQINQVSHWLDGSNIYGSSKKQAEELRKFHGGRLKTQSTPDGEELLPKNLECPGAPSKNCFKAGNFTYILCSLIL